MTKKVYKYHKQGKNLIILNDFDEIIHKIDISKVSGIPSKDSPMIVVEFEDPYDELDDDFTKAKFSYNKNINKSEIIAINRYCAGEKPSCSSFIDEDTIIAGYGPLEGYDFKYPLPPAIVNKIFGTTSWSKYSEINAESILESIAHLTNHVIQTGHNIERIKEDHGMTQSAYNVMKVRNDYITSELKKLKEDAKIFSKKAK